MGERWESYGRAVGERWVGSRRAVWAGLLGQGAIGRAVTHEAQGDTPWEKRLSDRVLHALAHLCLKDLTACLQPRGDAAEVLNGASCIMSVVK